MEYLVIISLICLLLTALLSPCASSQIQVQSFHHKQANNEFQPASIPTLSRKLRFATIVGKKEGSHFMSNKKEEHISVKADHKEHVMVHGNRGTRQEWMEGSDGTDPSLFFTMDYSHVKRRSPIHNKSLPVGP
ncbi:hypothetical protein FEM48_Zijuj10G0103600 [Ziziphus jujuba var. spinosa]|uniref:Root meristem growth factor 8 n=1 Tax=Ziziphus jujuba var. spinosa TaxID=714518 RepID=A0A978UMT9_ZIZJJ|nr:hypothetical protein FEM48_Zijuj10G0103600 [Ziziphus jujuba var. spinosa]